MHSEPTASTDCFAIAHLSDIHLGPLNGFTPSHWGFKRGLGYLNWQRGRKSLHRGEVVGKLVEDMRRQKPDHVAVTGDLVNIGLPSEIEAARGWLESLGAPADVTVVPGNHDIYVPLRRDPGVARWQAFMSGDGAEVQRGDGPGRGAGPASLSFPFVRRRGAVAIIGVNSALPTAPFVAAGRVPDAELDALGEVLRSAKAEGLARVVLIHHPPLPGQAPAIRGLRNARAFADVLARDGADIVLHGHNHSNSIVWVDEASRRVPVVGIASGSAAHHHKGLPLGRYNLVRLEFEDDHRRDGRATAGRARLKSIEIAGRGLSHPGGEVVELDHAIFDLTSR